MTPLMAEDVAVRVANVDDAAAIAIAISTSVPTTPICRV